MAKYYYYIDYGAGFVNINPHNNNLDLAIAREQNDFIQRKKLTGEFSLIGSEAVAAESYYIGSGNIDAPINIYENGTSGGGGTLVYDGVASTEGLFDYDQSGNAISVTFTTFKTTDDYTDFIPLLPITAKSGDIKQNPGSPISYFSPLKDKIAIESQATLCNEIRAYSHDGTNFSFTGTALNIGMTGRVTAMTIYIDTRTIVILDNANGILKTYHWSGAVWTASGIITDYVLSGSRFGNWAICDTSTVSVTSCVIVDDDIRRLLIMSVVAGVWTPSIDTSFFFPDMKYPSISTLNASGHYVITDDIGKELQVYSGNLKVGESFSISDVVKPKICTLDLATSTIALVDEFTGRLRAFRFTGTTWAELGGILVVAGAEPSLSLDKTNIVNYYDTENGLLTKYTFDGTSIWTKTGNTLSIGNGYSASVPGVQTTGGNVLGLIQSNTMVVEDPSGLSYAGYCNKLLYEVTSGGFEYGVPLTGNGAAIDITKLGLKTLNYIHDNASDLGANIEDGYNWSLKKLFKIAELFKSYWYLESTGSTFPDYDVKFTTPDFWYRCSSYSYSKSIITKKTLQG